MRLLELELINFGPHKHLKIDNITGNIIGLLGVNGSGKSNIVYAIKALLLGDLPEGSSTFITLGEDTATISGVLEIRGHKCKIIRSWGKKPERKLWIDHFDCPPITKSKDVTAEIEKLLGVDKTTAANTLIIAQNEIQNILRCGDAKRIELFVKWLNLGFITKHYDYLQSKIKELSKATVSVAPLKDAAALEEAKKEAFIAEYTNKLNKLNSIYIGKSQLEKFLDLFESYHKSSLEAAVCLETKNITEKKYKDAKLEYDKIQSKDLEELKLDISGLKESISNSEEKLTSIKQELSQLNMYKQQSDIIMSDMLGMSKFISELELFVKDPLSIKNGEELVYCAEFKNYISKLYELRKIESQSAIAENKKAELTQLTDSSNKLKLEVEQLANDIKQIDFKSSELKKHIIEHESLITMLKASPNKSTICPACGSLISFENVGHLENDINNYKEQSLELKNTHTALIEKQEKLIDDLALKNAKISELSSFISQVEQVLSAIKDQVCSAKSNLINAYNNLPNKDIVKFDSSNLEFDETQLGNMIPILSQLSQQSLIKLRDLNINRCNLDKDIKSIFYEENDEHLSCSDLIQKKSESIAQLSSELDKKRLTLNEYEINLREAEKRAAILSELEQSLELANTKLKNINLDEHPFMVFVNELKTVSTKEQQAALLLNGAISDIHSRVKCALNEYNDLNELETKIKLCKEFIDEKLELINKLEKENEAIYAKLEELNLILEEVNPKKGLMIDYLRYLFKFVIDKASEYLALWDSNFIIKLNDDNGAEALSLKFLRTDKMSDQNNNWLPMSKLSGGQGMRVAISLLLSVQSIICPGLNFLILDEPSTNLDAGGVASLASLLEKITEIGGNTSEEGQLWIVDHQKELERAFTTKVELNLAN